MDQVLNITSSPDELGRLSFSSTGLATLQLELGRDGMVVVGSVVAAVNEYNNFRNFCAGGRLASESFVSMSFSPVDGVFRIFDPLQKLESYDIFRRVVHDGREILEACDLSDEDGYVSARVRTYPFLVAWE